MNFDPALVALAAPYVTAAGAWALTSAAKKAPDWLVPYAAERKTSIVAALTIAAVVTRVGLAAATGTLGQLDAQAEVTILLQAFAAAMAAAGARSLVKSDKPII